MGGMQGDGTSPFIEILGGIATIERKPEKKRKLLLFTINDKKYVAGYDVSEMRTLTKDVEGNIDPTVYGLRELKDASKLPIKLSKNFSCLETELKAAFPHLNSVDRLDFGRYPIGKYNRIKNNNEPRFIMEVEGVRNDEGTVTISGIFKHPDNTDGGEDMANKSGKKVLIFEAPSAREKGEIFANTISSMLGSSEITESGSHNLDINERAGDSPKIPYVVLYTPEETDGIVTVVTGILRAYGSKSSKVVVLNQDEVNKCCDIIKVDHIQVTDDESAERFQTELNKYTILKLSEPEVTQNYRELLRMFLPGSEVYFGYIIPLGNTGGRAGSPPAIHLYTDLPPPSDQVTERVILTQMQRDACTVVSCEAEGGGGERVSIVPSSSTGTSIQVVNEDDSVTVFNFISNPNRDRTSDDLYTFFQDKDGSSRVTQDHIDKLSHRFDYQATVDVSGISARLSEQERQELEQLERNQKEDYDRTRKAEADAEAEAAAKAERVKERENSIKITRRQAMIANHSFALIDLKDDVKTHFTILGDDLWSSEMKQKSGDGYTMCFQVFTDNHETKPKYFVIKPENFQVFYDESNKRFSVLFKETHAYDETQQPVLNTAKMRIHASGNTGDRMNKTIERYYIPVSEVSTLEKIERIFPERTGDAVREYAEQKAERKKYVGATASLPTFRETAANMADFNEKTLKSLSLQKEVKNSELEELREILGQFSKTERLSKHKKYKSVTERLSKHKKYKSVKEAIRKCEEEYRILDDEISKVQQRAKNRAPTTAPTTAPTPAPTTASTTAPTTASTPAPTTAPAVEPEPQTKPTQNFRKVLVESDLPRVMSKE